VKKVLLVGDSIRLDYGKYLKNYLKDDIELYGRPDEESAYKNLDIAVGANGGCSNRVLDYVKEMVESDSFNFDYFVFNCGLHDIIRIRPEEKIVTDEETYRYNLSEILRIAAERKIKCAFISTTPAEKNRYSEDIYFCREYEDVLRYNQIAREVMTEFDVSIIDLFTFTESLGLVGDDLFRDHAHFRENVIQLQAAYISGAINSIVK